MVPEVTEFSISLLVVYLTTLYFIQIFNTIFSRCFYFSFNFSWDLVLNYPNICYPVHQSSPPNLQTIILQHSVRKKIPGEAETMAQFLAPFINRLAISIRNQLVHASDIERALSFSPSGPLLFLPSGCQKIYRPPRLSHCLPIPFSLSCAPPSDKSSGARAKYAVIVLQLPQDIFRNSPYRRILSSLSAGLRAWIYTGLPFRGESSSRMDNLIRVAISMSKLAGWRSPPLFEFDIRWETEDSSCRIGDPCRE